MRKIIALFVDDLIFLSKIQNTARSLQIETQSVIGSADESALRISQLSPSILIIDLNSKKADPLELIGSLKTSDGTSSIPIIGFLSHVDVDQREKAIAAGCDQVMPRSVFVQKLAEIFSGV
jgi:DNA-binding NarL/FixJ family response regulator